jgi:predicted phage-related endonuclease
MPDTLSQDTPEAVEFQLNMWIDTSFTDFDKFVENKDAASIYCQADGTTELYPEIEPTKDFEVLVERYAEAKKEMNRAAYEAEMIEAELKRIIGDNAGIKGLIAWPVVKSNRLDTKALKAEHPDLVDAYTKPSYTRRFTRVS